MTEKWTRPMAEVQQFAANEYVAACGDGGTWYNFTCDAGKGTYHWILLVPTKYVWTVKDKSGKVLANAYGPCEETHQASSSDEFLEGFIDDNFTSIDEHIPVIIWTDGGTNVHCTTNLNKQDWEIAKS